MLQSHLSWGPVQTPCSCSPPPHLHCCASALTHLQQQTVTLIKAAAWKRHLVDTYVCVSEQTLAVRKKTHSQLSWLSWCFHCPLLSAASFCWVGPDHKGGFRSALRSRGAHWAVAVAGASGRRRWGGNSWGSRERGPGLLPSAHWHFLNWTRRRTSETNCFLLDVTVSSLTVWLHPALITDSVWSNIKLKISRPKYCREKWSRPIDRHRNKLSSSDTAENNKSEICFGSDDLSLQHILFTTWIQPQRGSNTRYQFMLHSFILCYLKTQQSVNLQFNQHTDMLDNLH